MMSSLLFDLRYAVRTLRRSPVFAVVAVSSLALGIGANVAIFTILRSVVLQPLPYHQPQHLAVMWEQLGDIRGVAMETFIRWKENGQHYDRISLHGRGQRFALAIDGADPQELTGASISADFFDLLGVAPAVGRTFTADEEFLTAPNVVILSHGFWQSAFAGAMDAMGKTLVVNAIPYTVVGVMPPGFVDPLDARAALWIPIRQTPAQRASPALAYSVLARLSPDVDRSLVVEDAIAAQQQLRTERAGWRTDPTWTVSVVPLHESLVGNVRPTLLLSFAAVGFVLLVACANLANLMIARQSSRQKEMGIRIALGSGRARLRQQVLVESLFLSALGAGTGLWLAQMGISAFIATGPALPRLGAIQLSSTDLIFSFGLAITTGVMLGLVPAWRTLRQASPSVLREGSDRTTAPRERGLMRRGLVVVESALVVVLLTLAGLTLRNLQTLIGVEPGIPTDNRIALQMTLPRAKYPAEQDIAAFFNQVAERIAQSPGITSTTVTTTSPLGASFWNSLYVPGAEQLDGERPITGFEAVSPEYFTTMDLPLLAGRTFTASEAAVPANVAIINEALANRYFADQDPIGRAVAFGQDEPTFRIVGVAPNVMASINEPPGPHLYLPNLDVNLPWRTGGRYIVAHTAGDPIQAIPVLRAAVASVDPAQPISWISPLTDLRSRLFATQRLTSSLFGMLGGAGLLLGIVGIYGVVSSSVGERRREVGIRLALGASNRAVLQLLMRRELSPVLLGVVLGMIGTVAAGQAIANVVSAVSPRDLSTFIGVATIAIIAGCAAVYLPVLRATRTDPVTTLRAE